MGLELTVTLDGAGGGAELAALRDWLIEGDAGFRGRIRLQSSPPAPGMLGPVLEALGIVLGPGGSATALVALAVSWVRHRTADVDVVVTLADGRSVRLAAKRLRGMDPVALAALVESYGRSLSLQGPSAVDASPPPAPAAIPGGEGAA